MSFCTLETWGRVLVFGIHSFFNISLQSVMNTKKRHDTVSKPRDFSSITLFVDKQYMLQNIDRKYQ